MTDAAGDPSSAAGLTRRGVLHGTAALFLCGPAAAAGPATRVVTIDWGLAETLVAIGAPPAGLAETAGYREWVGAPPLPEGVAEIGLRTTPNLEFVAALKPDVIASTPQFAAIRPSLERVAPVIEFATFTEALTPYRNAVEVARGLGALVGREADAERLVQATEARLDRLAEAVGGRALRPALVATFHDARQLWVYGPGSLFHDALVRAGIADAWTGDARSWGIFSVSADRLAPLADAALMIVEPLPAAVRARLADAAPKGLLGRLPAIRDGRFRILPPLWSFGGLFSVGRFADAMRERLDALEPGDGR